MGVMPKASRPWETSSWKNLVRATWAPGQVDPSWTKTGIGGKELGFEVAAGNRGLRSLTRKPCLLPPGRTAAQRPPQRPHRHKSVGEGDYRLSLYLL